MTANEIIVSYGSPIDDDNDTIPEIHDIQSDNKYEYDVCLVNYLKKDSIDMSRIITKSMSKDNCLNVIDDEIYKAIINIQGYSADIKYCFQLPTYEDVTGVYVLKYKDNPDKYSLYNRVVAGEGWFARKIYENRLMYDIFIVHRINTYTIKNETFDSNPAYQIIVDSIKAIGEIHRGEAKITIDIVEEVKNTI